MVKECSTAHSLLLSAVYSIMKNSIIIESMMIEFVINNYKNNTVAIFSFKPIEWK